jgi:hypothetical protein
MVNITSVLTIDTDKLHGNAQINVISLSTRLVSSRSSHDALIAEHPADCENATQHRTGGIWGPRNCTLLLVGSASRFRPHDFSWPCREQSVPTCLLIMFLPQATHRSVLCVYSYIPRHSYNMVSSTAMWHLQFESANWILPKLLTLPKCGRVLTNGVIDNHLHHCKAIGQNSNNFSNAYFIYVYRNKEPCLWRNNCYPIQTA